MRLRLLRSALTYARGCIGRASEGERNPRFLQTGHASKAGGSGTILARPLNTERGALNAMF